MSDQPLSVDASRVVKIMEAALPYMPSFWGREIGAQMMCWAREDVTETAIADRIRDRAQHWGAECSDVEACAAAMLAAYLGQSKPAYVASGKWGPRFGLGRAANGRA